MPEEQNHCEKFENLKAEAQKQVAEAIGILHKTENFLIQICRVCLDPELHLRIEDVIRGDLLGEKASIQKERNKLREIEILITNLEYINPG